MNPRYTNRCSRLDKRDEDLKPLHARLSIAKARRDKVQIRNLEKEIKAVHDRYFWVY